MIGKGIFHTNIVVRDLAKSLKFYTGLFGMEDTGFKDGDYVFLTTPGRNDLLTLNPRDGIPAGFPGGCAIEDARERKENLPGVQGGVSHFGYMLPNLEEYERVIASVGEFGGRLLTRCEHGGTASHTYLADPDGYTVEIHYGR
jgi:catechol 2,3-dioxygenase-like lactoylglutathione lyase family enzyme